MTNYCLYHANCPDGFMSAFVVWLKYGDTFKYLPVSYQEPVPIDFSESIDKIFIVDFSYNEQITKELIKHCRGLVVIDHHDDAERQFLKNSEFAYFDPEHSGCVLTWKRLFNEPVPQVLKYVEDRDLWKWEIYNSRIINLGLSLIKHDFNEYKNKLNPFDYNVIDYLYKTGLPLHEYKQKIIEKHVDSIFRIKIFGFTDIPCVNCTAEHSEVGEGIYTKYDVPFVVTYYVDQRNINISLRTNKEDILVNKLANKYGGGGHPKAAGFKISVSLYSQFIGGIL